MLGVKSSLEKEVFCILFKYMFVFKQNVLNRQSSHSADSSVFVLSFKYVNWVAYEDWIQ